MHNFSIDTCIELINTIAILSCASIKIQNILFRVNRDSIVYLTYVIHVFPNLHNKLEFFIYFVDAHTHGIPIKTSFFKYFNKE